MARTAKKISEDVERKLDEALNQTFPASDPVSLGRNDHPGKPDRPSSPEETRKRPSNHE
jgi:hypothetical protein